MGAFRGAVPAMIKHKSRPAIHRLNASHGVAFFDFEIAASDLARVSACFVEEVVETDEGEQPVLLALGKDNFFEDGTAWHPETFKPLGPGDAIWLSGYQGLQPLVGTWLPLPYLRVMANKSQDGRPFDDGPSNWARVFIAPPDGPAREASSFKGVLAIDTQLSAASRLDQALYTAPTDDDVSLGSTFMLADDIEHLATSFLASSWIDGWLREVTGKPDKGQPPADVAGDAGLADQASKFELEHVARYLFALKVLCEAASLPALRLVSPKHETDDDAPAPVELVVDLADDVGLAALLDAGDGNRPVVLAMRDLAQPTVRHQGALPVSVEFDQPVFGSRQLSRRSGRGDAFHWPAMVRIGREAERMSRRENACTGKTGASSLAGHVRDDEVLDRSWQISVPGAPCDAPRPVVRPLAMAHLTEAGALIRDRDTVQPSLRPRFSRSSLVTFFLAEVVLQAISALNVARASEAGGRRLVMLRLALPVSMPAAERSAIEARARESIDFVWQALNWTDTAHSPAKPAVETGPGGDLGVQLMYLQDQLRSAYAGGSDAFVSDLGVGPKPGHAVPDAVRLATITLGLTASRSVVADYDVGNDGYRRPHVHATWHGDRGLNAVVEAITEQHLIPTIHAALRQAGGECSPADLVQLTGGAVALDGRFPEDYGRQVRDKILFPAARSLLNIHAASTPGISRGLEQFTLGRLIELQAGPGSSLIRLFDKRAGAAGAADFSLKDVLVSLPRQRMHRIVKAELGAILSAAMSTNDCAAADLLLVMPALPLGDDLKSALFASFQVMPHRLVILQDGDLAGHQLNEVALSQRAGVAGALLAGQRNVVFVMPEATSASGQLEAEVA